MGAPDGVASLRQCDRRAASNPPLGVRLASLARMTTQLHRVGAGIICSTLVLVAGASSAAPAPTDQPANATVPHAATPQCIDVRAEARRAATGYEHWVFIESDCDLAAACDVSTDVNPESLTVTVQPRSTARVLTAAAASSSKFTPYVTCQLGPVD